MRMYNQIKIHRSEVHCGSAFEPGGSGLPYYCTPPVCVPAVLGALAVWRLSTNKTKNFQRILWPNNQVGTAQAFSLQVPKSRTDIFHNNEFDEMRCKLDSTKYARSTLLSEKVKLISSSGHSSKLTSFRGLHDHNLLQQVCVRVLTRIVCLQEARGADFVENVFEHLIGSEEVGQLHPRPELAVEHPLLPTALLRGILT